MHSAWLRYALQTLVAAIAAGLLGCAGSPPVFTAVTARGDHTCGIKDAPGAAYCWGANGSGELGTASTTNSSIPVVVAGGLSFAAVTAGDSYTCVVTGAGSAYCWGYNDWGQLGNTTLTIDSPIPVVVTGGLKFAALTAGLAHTCGVTNANNTLTAAGAAYCWGSNGSGELGDNSTTAKSSPSRVQAPAGVIFAAVTAGGYHTCGVTDAGAAYCWGNNARGQLGDGTTTDRSIPVPVLVARGVRFLAVTAGGSHTCGVTDAGTAFCWGANDFSQLGDGTQTDRSTPVLVAIGVRLFAAVTASGGHTCVVTKLAGAYCWGANFFGELGDGTTTLSRVPVPVVQ